MEGVEEHLKCWGRERFQRATSNSGRGACLVLPPRNWLWLGKLRCHLFLTAQPTM